MHEIQFQAVVNGDIIRIPEQYLKLVPADVKVTIVPVKDDASVSEVKTKAGGLSLKDFTSFIDTRGFKFDREEANERR